MKSTVTRKIRRFEPALDPMEERLSLSRFSFHVGPQRATFHAPHRAAVHPIAHVTTPKPVHIVQISAPAPAPAPAPIPAPAPMPATTPTAPTSSLNAAVVAAAQSQLGKTVGDGQCTGLVSWALDTAGAQSYFPSNGPNPDDYAWGRLVATITPGNTSTANIQPGDVIQYRDVQITSSIGGGGTMTMTATHHTSLVSGVSGGTISVLEQNVNNQQFVQAGTLNLNGMTAGTMWVYSPVAK